MGIIEYFNKEIATQMGALCESEPHHVDQAAPAGVPAKKDSNQSNAEIAASPIKIEYFAGHYGRPDPIRQMLEHKQISFKFIGYTGESWVALKEAGNTGEMGSLPVIHYGGQGRQQANAVMRSLGAAHGYYDTSDWKTCGIVDMIVETYDDLFTATAKALLFLPEEEKEAALEAIKDGIVTKFLAMCEKRFEHNSD